MDQLTENLRQINRAFKKFSKGAMTPDQVISVVAMAKEARSTVHTHMQIIAMSGKKQNVGEILERKGLYSSTTTIDFEDGDPEVDKVKCPCHDNLITRAECLDYSGTHHDDCGGCEIGTATKDKLLPER